VQTDKTKESLAEINRELRAFLGDHGATAEELMRIQANETLSLPGSRETLGSVGSSIIDLVQYRWSDDFYDTMTGKIRALKTTDLDAAAKQVIHPDNIIWVVVGDRAKIEHSIRELGLGEIQFIDADGNPALGGANGGQ
jgi:zinc protease